MFGSDQHVEGCCGHSKKWPSGRGRGNEKSKHLLPQKTSWYQSLRSELRSVRTEQTLLQLRVQSFQEEAPTGSPTLKTPLRFTHFWISLNPNEIEIPEHCARDLLRGFTSLVFFCSGCHVQKPQEAPQTASSPVPGGDIFITYPLSLDLQGGTTSRTAA